MQEADDGICSLAYGWDGYGAPPPSPAAATRAGAVLTALVGAARLAGVAVEAPQCAPSADDSIVLEWRGNERHLIIEVSGTTQGDSSYLELPGARKEHAARTSEELWTSVRPFFDA